MARVVMFDIDGTLTQTCEVDACCYTRALGDLLGTTDFSRNWADYAHATDPAITTEVIESVIGRPAEPSELDSVRLRFVELLEEAFDAAPTACRAVPGAGPVLDVLRGHADYEVCLATGGWRESAELKLRRADLAREDVPLASGSDAYDRESIMRKALGCVGLGEQAAPAVVYLGDAVWDLHATRVLGYRFIGVGAGRKAEELRREGAERIINEYADPARFLDLLDGVFGALP